VTRDRALRASVVATALVAAAAAVVAGSAPRAGGDPAAREGQALVRGLGLGTALDLSPCARGFDPRVGTSCGLRHDLLPGAGCLGPRHAGTLP
jgi:hypothetical protein